MGLLFYHTSHAPGLLFWLNADVIANLIRVRVANHQLAVQDLLELLADYQVVCGWLSIIVARICATLLSFAATPGHHSVMVLELVHGAHPIPAASSVHVPLASPVRLAIDYYQRTLCANAPTLDRRARKDVSIEP